MALLDILDKQKEARPMMGRANFSIQRPSPRVRLDKFKAVIDPRMMEQQDNPAPYEGQGFERLTGNPANTDAGFIRRDSGEPTDIGFISSQDGETRNALGEQVGELMENPRQGQAESEVANILAEISGIQGKDYGPRKKGGWKDILLGLGLGAMQGVANSDPRGGLGAMLGGAIGGGAAGGVGGAVDGSTDNRMRDRLRLDRLYNDYGQASKVADIEQNRAYRGKQMEKIDLEEANRLRDDAFRAENAQRDYDLKVKMADWKIEDRKEYYEWEKVKETARRAGKQQDYELAVRKQDEIERNNKVKTDQTERKGMPKNNVPLPASSFVPPKTGKTSEQSARAYLQTKGLKGDALENAIKTARANGEIQ